MVVLLAESKTMSSAQREIDYETFIRNKPALEELADDSMNFISSLSTIDISNILGISNQLASKVATLAYDFPNKSIGYKTLYAFTGEAYRALQSSTLSNVAKEKAANDLRIISSLYGFLTPENIIKPYRLEFNKNCAPGNLNMAKFLKPKVTVEFVRYLKETHQNEIINLLPADADLCMDWKIIKAFAKVYKVCFKEIAPGGTFKTPLAKKLKESRGLMCREILENNINSFNQLITFESAYFHFFKEASKTGLPVFLV